MARTGAETTVVFDAAEPDQPGPWSSAPRGVKVLFSPPGVIADDVIRDLVAAEPPGRTVVVVTDDQEVAGDARARRRPGRVGRRPGRAARARLRPVRRLARPDRLSVVAVRVPDMTTRIDCDTCVVRGLACHDCVVTVLLGPPPELTFDDDECRALDVLAAGRPGAAAAAGAAVASPEIESA